MFVVVDTFLNRKTAGSSAGLALLAGVTLDGIPDNAALWISLNDSESVALLVAVFASNFPEALADARRMTEKGRSATFVVGPWCAAVVLLALAVVAGRYLFAGAPALNICPIPWHSPAVPYSHRRAERDQYGIPLLKLRES